MKEFYTYVLIRPNGTPFYVGKGCGQRYLRCGGNQHVWNIYRQIVAAGLKVGLCIIPVVDEAAAFAKEIELIALYGRRDLGTGSLCNLTNGGSGGTHLVTAETRARMSAAMIKRYANPIARLKTAQSVKGLKRSEIAKANYRRAWEDSVRLRANAERARINTLGRKRSEETKARIRASHVGMRGKRHSAETIKKMRGQKRSAETRQRMRDAWIRRKEAQCEH